MNRIIWAAFVSLLCLVAVSPAVARPSVHHSWRATTQYAGQVTTLTGKFPNATAVTFDAGHGVFYVSANAAIYQVTLAGVVTQLCKFSAPIVGGLVYDSTNQLIYATDTDNFKITSISLGCATTLVAGGTQGTADGQGASAQFQHPTGMALDATRQILFVADVDRIRAVTVGGTVTTFTQPGAIGQYGFQYNGQVVIVGLSFSATANSIYVADSTRNAVERIDSLGRLHPISGHCVSLGPPQCQPLQIDGPNGKAGFASPDGVVLDTANGALYVADSGNNEIRVLPGRTVGTLAGSGAVGAADGLGILASFIGPDALAVDPVSGTMLVADAGNKLLRFVTTQGSPPPPPPHGTVTYNPPTYLSGPTSVAITADGSVWFDEHNVARIGRLEPTGKIVEYPLPSFRWMPGNLVLGSDGNVWFSDSSFLSGASAAVARISATGVITEYPLSTTQTISGLTLGSDGNVWFADSGAGMFGNVSPSGVLTVFNPGYPDYPFIAAGYDGNIWTFLPAFGNDQVFIYNTSGTLVNTITMPDGDYFWLENGGATTKGMWFSYSPGPGGASLDLLPAQGRLKQYAVPHDGGCQSFAGPLNLGPDNNIWYGWGETCQFSLHSDMLGSMTPLGTSTLFPVYDARSAPAGMAFAADGTLWFADPGANKIGKLY